MHSSQQPHTPSSDSSGFRVAGERSQRSCARRRAPLLLVLSGVIVASISGCRGTRPAELGLVGAVLRPCPERPNCVSSEAPQAAAHFVAPLRTGGDARADFGRLRELLGKIPRVTVVTATDAYIHAECESKLMRFVDDLELRLDAEGGVVHVRSGARLGYRDFDVNRERVELLRALLASSANDVGGQP